MTSQNLHISSIEKKHSEKTGKDFWSVETSLGKMNLFDAIVAEEIEKAGVPNDFNVDVQTKGNWKNITSITMDEDGQTPAPVTAPVEKAPNILSSDEKKFSSMAISYAKDLVVAGKVEHAKLRLESLALLDLYREMTGVVEGEKKST